MNKKNIDLSNELLAEIDECYKLLEKKDIQINTIEDPQSRLEQLERYKEWIGIINDFLEKEQPDEMSRETSIELSEDTKELLQKAQEVEHAGLTLQKAFSTALKNRKRTKRKGKEERHVKQRKKLFKTIGGDQKWIPL